MKNFLNLKFGFHNRVSICLIMKTRSNFDRTIDITIITDRTILRLDASPKRSCAHRYYKIIIYCEASVKLFRKILKTEQNGAKHQKPSF